MMPSRLICRLLVDEIMKHRPIGRGNFLYYLNFLKQEARTKKLQGRTGYQMAVKEIQR